MISYVFKKLKTYNKNIIKMTSKHKMKPKWSLIRKKSKSKCNIATINREIDHIPTKRFRQVLNDKIMLDNINYHRKNNNMTPITLIPKETFDKQQELIGDISLIENMENMEIKRNKKYERVLSIQKRNNNEEYIKPVQNCFKSRIFNKDFLY